MAEGKKSFIAYANWKDVFDELPNEEAGGLIKHIFAYVNDENPETDSVLIKAVFANIKSTLKRDLEKWEKQLKQRSDAGKLSAESRSTKINERSTVVKSRARKSTVNVNVNDSVNGNVSVPVNEKEKKITALDVASPLSDYQICVDFWLKEFHPGWTFTGQHGKALNSILAKLKTIIKDFSPPPEVFKKVCLSLPEWYKNKDLQVIDSKFNELITEIKDKRNGQQSPNTTNRGTHPLQQMHDVSSELLKSLANSGNVQGGA